jgi:phosphosulfolactate synthase (CoM biosynthesis protein A)
MLPENWNCAKHDKNLLIAISDNGIDNLKNISGNKEYGFEDIEISPELAFIRIEEVCEFFKNYQQSSKVVKKVKKETGNENTNTDKFLGGVQRDNSIEHRKKLSKLQVISAYNILNL